MDGLGIALSEISHSEKDKHCMLSLMYNPKNKLVNITTTTTTKQTHGSRELVVTTGESGGAKQT